MNMPLTFGIIFAIVCLIGGLLMVVCCQPFWWLMKKKEMPSHYKWYLRIPGILLMLLGIGIIGLAVVEHFMFQ